MHSTRSLVDQYTVLSASELQNTLPFITDPHPAEPHESGPPHIQISGHLPGSMQLVQCASHLRRRLGPTVDFVASKAGAYSKAANQLQGRCMLQRDFDNRRRTLFG